MKRLLPDDYTPVEDIGDAEYVVAWASQGLDQKNEVCIYGNPAGLRHLARILLGLAELDQTTLNMPDTDTDHAHLRSGINTEACDSLPQLRIGRVDKKLDSSRINDGWPRIVVELGDKGITDAYDSHCHAVWPDWNCEKYK